MEKTISILLLFSLMTIVSISSCKKEKLVTPVCDGTVATYNLNVKAIIDNNCNNASCHGTGSSKGDFTTYNGIKPYLDNGKFKNSVLDNQTMPQGSAKLSSDELNKIKCWQESNYPEK